LYTGLGSPLGSEAANDLRSTTIHLPVTGSLVPSLPVCGLVFPLDDQLSDLELFGLVACEGAT